MTTTPDEKTALRIAAAKAMGWKLRPRIFHNSEWKNVPTWFAPAFADHPADYCPAGQMLGAGVPAYESDANATLELCEVLVKEGWSPIFKRSKATTKWTASFGKFEKYPPKTFEATAPTLPEAITRAFLAVRGVVV